MDHQGKIKNEPTVLQDVKSPLNQSKCVKSILLVEKIIYKARNTC